MGEWKDERMGTFKSESEIVRENVNMRKREYANRQQKFFLNH